ncbi:MAG: sugar ABC transporter substrate-binding protein, partial [Lachnospiraceae bacterium]
LIRSQCGDQVKATSWQAIFASDDAEFDQMWDEMCVTLEGLGWDQLVEFDTDKYQAVVDAREAAVAE